MNPLVIIELALRIVLLAMEGQSPEQRAKIWAWYVSDMEKLRKWLKLDALGMFLWRRLNAHLLIGPGDLPTERVVRFPGGDLRIPVEGLTAAVARGRFTIRAGECESEEAGNGSRGPDVPPSSAPP